MKGTLIRFHFKAFVVSVAFVAIALAAILHPNRISWLWVSLCSAFIFVAVAATAMGACGRTRLQCASFCLAATTYYVGVSLEHSPFAEAEALSRAAIERFTNNLKPRASPDGSMVYQDFDGNFSIRRNTSSSWESITQEQIEASKLTGYAVTEQTSVSASAFAGIYRHLMAVLVGWLGFSVTGLAYNYRRSQRRD